MKLPLPMLLGGLFTMASMPTEVMLENVRSRVGTQDLDDDGYALVDGDCDDFNIAIHPDLPDACDGIDNDCDGQTDEDSPIYFRDLDGDGFGSRIFVRSSCLGQEEAGWVTNADDCDDADEYVYPGARELCDRVDNDCDARVDEGLPRLTLFEDLDGDGAGNPNVRSVACLVPFGFSLEAGDPDDLNFMVPAY